jgi:hypothetical protein
VVFVRLKSLPPWKLNSLRVVKMKKLKEKSGSLGRFVKFAVYSLGEFLVTTSIF